MSILDRTTLPTTVHVSQDGGYFYFTAKEDTDWRIEGDNPLLYFVESPFDPEFGDFATCAKAREWLRLAYPELTLIFGGE